MQWQEIEAEPPGLVAIYRYREAPHPRVSFQANGRILYRGRSAQSFRDPGFLGIVDPENDAVYLPLRKGSNDLLLPIGELGGGWGFRARLTDVGP